MKVIRLFKTIVLVTSVGLLLIYFIFGAAHAAKQVVNAINLCLNIMIPSLFGFIVLSSFLISSGLYEKLLFPLYIIPEKLFHCDRKRVCIFILSLIGGYPVGAKLLSEAVYSGEMSKEDAARMLIFCYCPAPPFVIYVVGVGLFNSIQIGLLIYLSCLVSNVIIALFSFILHKKKTVHCSLVIPTKKKEGALVSSVSGGIKAMAFICGLIVWFHLMLGALEFFHLLTFPGIIIEKMGFGGENGVFLIKSFFEIGTVSLMSKPGIFLLPLFGGLFSFGGLCILSQCIALTKGLFPIKNFLLWRVPAALLSGLFMLFFTNIGGESLKAYLTITKTAPIVTWSGMPIASICLIFMAVLTMKELYKNENA